MPAAGLEGRISRTMEEKILQALTDLKEKVSRLEERMVGLEVKLDESNKKYEAIRENTLRRLERSQTGMMTSGVRKWTG